MPGFNSILRAFASLGHDLGNSYVYNPNPNSFDCPLDSYHPPYPTYETYSYDSYGNDSQFGYDCQPQLPLTYESEPGYNENYTSYPYDSSSLPQQYPCCTRCGGPHETCQCDQLIFDEPYCKHCGGPHMNYHTHPSKRLTSFCYDDDDEEDYTSAITPNEPVLSTEEPDNSLSMGDEHLDTIPATESDEVIKSSVESLIPILRGIEASNDNPIPFYDPIISGTPPNLTPSGESDFFLETKSSSTSLNSLLEETNNFDNSLPEFTTFSKVLFDAEYESDSSDDQSCSDEDVLEKIVSKPLSEEEIIPMKLDQHLDNAESDLMESLRTHDSSLLISSKIDSLLDEFASELTLLKLIPSGINEIDCDFEEDIRLIKKLLYDNSSPRPPKEFISANSDAKIESFSLSPILVKDIDSLIEEIDLFCTPDYPMPPGIMDEDYDSERDIPIPKDLPSNNTLSFAKKSHSILIFLRFLEKSPDLLSHRGLKAFHPFATCPMMIHGQNNPILDVLLFYFYPP
nr:hypothetical protein [Tanacetum cinerariifolium]